MTCVIAVSGTHGTNKTMVSERVFEILGILDKQAVLVSETTRKVKGRGYKLGKHATREARLFALKEQLVREQEVKAEYVILDRSALCSFAYLLYGVGSRHDGVGMKHDPQVETMRKAVKKQIQRYTHIFYIPLTQKASYDPDFQIEVACIIEQLIRDYRLKPVHRLTGDVEKDALEIIKVSAGYEKVHRMPMIAGDREAFVNKKTGHAIIREEIRIPSKLLKETYGGGE